MRKFDGVWEALPREYRTHVAAIYQKGFIIEKRGQLGTLNIPSKNMIIPLTETMQDLDDKALAQKIVKTIKQYNTHGCYTTG